MKRLAILISAAAALAITPAAAAAPNPGKHDRSAKVRVEKVKKARPDSARARCSAERQDLGAADFAAKYGKARAKGSAKAKAKAARAAFGRCVAKTAKVIRAEREAAAIAEEEAEDEAADLEELQEAADEGLLEDGFVDDAPGVETPEPDDGDLGPDLE